MSMYLYSTYAENYIKSAFSEVVSCARKEYYNPNEDADENEDEEREGEVSEYCKRLMEEDAASMVSFALLHFNVYFLLCTIQVHSLITATFSPSTLISL